MKKKLPKAQAGKAKTDSTAYYKEEAKNRADLAVVQAKSGKKEAAKRNMAASRKAYSDASRQQFKGKPGFDSMGNPTKKKGGTTKSKSKKK